MTAAQRERAALVEAMRAVGPEEPTLCEGWKTRDLAAHLYIRERRLDATAGIAVPGLSSYTEKVQNQVADGIDWDEMLDKIAAGPPVYSPFKLLDPVANLAEMFIHHEDVRRAQPNWEPRPLDDATVKGLTRTLSLMARLTLAKAPVRVALRTPEGKTLLTAGKGDPVIVTGKPEELLLFAVGREARVDFDGDVAAVQALRDAPKGL
ncbi:TIGR03085 family protein [Mycobacterium sp. PS03-16]|uniref:TIGR03085 family metal-binding protein n=1 Tax=Mycobacterium sp. PS03-16 TaxID=2559611 RepID=UPI00107444C7|nr:TIGR03085 family metal-binding protein [Mycobacterium sp. PS03-16]TFV59092.1 TIGR03085 family protein [Mycobacterium sp. PS03-16]